MVECANGSTVGVPRCVRTVIVLSLKAKVCVRVGLERSRKAALSVFTFGSRKMI